MPSIKVKAEGQGWEEVVQPYVKVQGTGWVPCQAVYVRVQLQGWIQVWPAS